MNPNILWNAATMYPIKQIIQLILFEIIIIVYILSQKSV